MPNKRYILTGGGAWDQYVEEYHSVNDAKRAAIYWLGLGYDAHLFDTDTGAETELEYRYDGLGIS